MMSLPEISPDLLLHDGAVYVVTMSSEGKPSYVLGAWFDRRTAELKGEAEKAAKPGYEYTIDVFGEDPGVTL